MSFVSLLGTITTPLPQIRKRSQKPMQTPKDTIDILFFGDIVGRPGREAVKWYLSQLPPDQKADVVIANVENATHGFGLSEKNYNELLDAGVDIMTGGNHIWDRKEIFEFIYSADKLLRPANFPGQAPGVGAKVFEINGIKIGVLNLIGQVFMGNYNSPWEQLDALLPQLVYETPIVFIDFHAEASAEKIACARYASQLGASAFTGTHTHVQTADQRIFNDRMGYITDSGFCGIYESIIGMKIEPGIDRLRTMYPNKMDVADGSIVQVNGSRFTVAVKTGICQNITRVNVVHDLETETTLRQDIEALMAN